MFHFSCDDGKSRRRGRKRGRSQDEEKSLVGEGKLSGEDTAEGGKDRKYSQVNKY